jgi:hypothetical protein
MTISSNQFNPASFVGSQGKYDNWMTYAGIKPTDTLHAVVPHTTQPGGSQADQSSPQNLSQYIDQAVAPMQNKMTNYANAGSQLLSGNFAGALKSIHAGQNDSGVPGLQASTPPAVTDTGNANQPKANPYDYSNIED